MRIVFALIAFSISNMKVQATSFCNFSGLTTFRATLEVPFADTLHLSTGSFVDNFESPDTSASTLSKKKGTLGKSNELNTPHVLSKGRFISDSDEPRVKNPRDLASSARSSTSIEFQRVVICEGQALSVGESRYSKAGDYITKLRTTQGADSLVYTRLIVEKLDMVMSEDVVVEKGKTVKLEGEVERDGRFAFQWLPEEGLSCPTCIVTEANPDKTTNYKLFITDLDGVCNQNKNVKLAVRDCDFSIPDAFTPNADNVNDIFYILSLDCVKQVEDMRIFDESGKVIYQKSNFNTSDPQYGWDGKVNGRLAKPGRYPYTIMVEFADGEKSFRKGMVQLIL